jgi:Na+-driven multidrug efflux pump
MSNILISFIISLLLRIFVKDWENIFGLGDEINGKLEELLDVFCITVSLEGVHIILASVLSAIGQQDFILNFTTVTLYLLGIGSGIYLGHVKGRLYLSLILNIFIDSMVYGVAGSLGSPLRPSASLSDLL